MKSYLKKATVVVMGIFFMQSAWSEQLHTCHTETQPMHEYVDLSFNGNEYLVSHYGHSRNTYEAIYTVVHTRAPHIGETLELLKIEDKSTWQGDMPDVLFIQNNVAPRMDGSAGYILNGLFDHEVFFLQEDCHFPGNN